MGWSVNACWLPDAHPPDWIEVATGCHNIHITSFASGRVRLALAVNAIDAFVALVDCGDVVA